MDIGQPQQQVVERLEQGRPGDAVGLLNRLIAHEPANSAHLILRSEALSQLGRSQSALADARRAVRIDPGNPRCHRVRALLCWHVDLSVEAEEAFEVALALASDDPDIEVEYALFLADRREITRAEATAELLLGHHPDSADAWATLGMVRRRQRRSAEADACFARARELSADGEAVWPDLMGDRAPDLPPGQTERARALCVDPYATWQYTAKMLVRSFLMAGGWVLLGVAILSTMKHNTPGAIVAGACSVICQVLKRQTDSPGP